MLFTNLRTEMQYNYIAIEGNIGAGKTTLATKLAEELKAELILERFIENPFLEKFYQNPAEYAFPLELSFLMDRFAQLKNYTEPKHFSGKLYMADYFFGKCLVFAKQNLPADQFDLYKKLHEALNSQLPQPEIIIFLHQEVKNLQRNIASRGRHFEQNIADDYLHGIEKSYLEFMQAVKNIPVIYVDVCNADFVSRGEDYSKLRMLINKSWPAGISFIKV